MKLFKHLTTFSIWLRTITILPCIMLLTLPLAAQEDSTDVNGVTIETVASDKPISNNAPNASKNHDS